MVKRKWRICDHCAILLLDGYAYVMMDNGTYWCFCDNCHKKFCAEMIALGKYRKNE